MVRDPNSGGGGEGGRLKPPQPPTSNVVPGKGSKCCKKWWRHLWAVPKGSDISGPMSISLNSTFNLLITKRECYDILWFDLLKAKTVNVSHQKYSRPKIAHQSSMAAIEKKMATWSKAVKTMIWVFLDQFTVVAPVMTASI